MIEDPSAGRVATEVKGEAFVDGVDRGRWRIVRYAFPILDVAISATEPDGTTSEYVMHFELMNYPAQAPMVRIWDATADAGNSRVALAFQQWGDDTVYRPWDRRTGPHNNNAANLPHLAWRCDRDLTFILEDIHAILNLNARALRHRHAA